MKIARVFSSGLAKQGNGAEPFVLRRLADGRSCLAPKSWQAEDIARFLSALPVNDGFDEEALDQTIDLAPVLAARAEIYKDAALRTGLPAEDAQILRDEIHALMLQKKLWFRAPAEAAEPRWLAIEDPDSAKHMALRRTADMTQAALTLGQRVLRRTAEHVMAACDRSSVFGFDPLRNAALARAISDALAAGLDSADVERILSYARQGYEDIPFFDAEPADAPTPEKILLSIPDSFFETAITGHGFFTPHGHIQAPERLEHIAETIWASGAPAISFRDRKPLRRPAGAFADTVAVIDVSGFVHAAARGGDLFDAAGLAAAVRVIITALDLTALDADLPLAVTGFAVALMMQGVPYDSDAARAFAAVLTAHVAAVAEETSALLAVERGAIATPDEHLQAQQKNRLAQLTDAYARRSAHQAPLSRAVDVPLAVCKQVSTGLWQAAIVASEAAVVAARTGLRHTLFIHADDGPPHGLSPLLHIIELAGSGAADDAGHARRLHGAVVQGLRRLGYTARQIDDMHAYAAGHGTLVGAPGIDHDALLAAGLTPQHVARIETALAGAHTLRQVFTPWTTGIEADDILAHLGFDRDAIDAAHLYACGAMTLEGAPHLRPDHVAVFDVLLPSTEQAVRSVTPQARLRLQAAVELFLQTPADMILTLPPEATIDDIQFLILKSWEMGLKQLDIYRDGCTSWRPLLLGAAESVAAVADPLPIRQKTKAAS